MEEKIINYSGSIKLKNPKTILKWIKNGWFKKEIDQGYFFAVGCGRFTMTKCTCSNCRTRKRTTIRELLQNNNIPEEQYN